MEQNNFNQKKHPYILGFGIGALSGFIVFLFLAIMITKSYGMSIQEYKELSDFKEFTKYHYYENTDNISFEEGIRKGIVDALNDPYSKYLNQEEFEAMLEDTKGSFVGIGVYIAPTQENEIVVISPIKNTPAEKAGIKSGDIIDTVDGKKYNAKELQDAVKAMRGKEGEKVKIGIVDKDGKYRQFTIIREAIHPQTVDSKVIENDIGYIQIISFEEKTAEEFRENYKKLSDKNVKSLIIDIRSNPGGLVDQVIDIADQIMPKATIVYTNNKNNEKQYYESDDREQINLPMVVLVDEGSASSSEILSGALQDNKLATIVGQKTYGKGVIQSVIELKGKGGLVITTAQYYTPNGNIVHKKGITPDIKVESKLNTKEKDVQLNKAIEVLKQKISKNK